ncbi:MAG TPA: ABC transporter permease [Allosphingosinicella sp.]|jgi:phospholipid/cholesterol/gamma-HCH transport system permease protein
MSSAAFQILIDRTGPTVKLSGDWTSLTLGEEAMGLRAALRETSGPARIALDNLGRLDTAGAYAILRAIHPSPAPAAAPDRPDVARLFDLVRPAIEKEEAEAGAPNWLYGIFDGIGRGLYAFADEALRAAAFVGQLISALGRTIRHPSRLRGISVTRVMETAGADALPIIMVMNFFIGTVVALVGANLLSSLGVSVFTVELVGVAVLREFAILFTAILLAGRSASSFAAQIGSMKMNQEVDAMQVMGVDQFDALVVPRVLALLWMMPLLTFAGMISGIVGGLLVSWVAMDMSPTFFLERLQQAVPARHFWIGMSKAPLLAILIATAGCRHGLFVGGDVESLGQRVTSAVVQAIFMIILFDAIFALIYLQLGL